MLVLCLLLCRFFFFSSLLLNVSSPRRTSTHTYIHTKLAKLIVHLNHCPCLFSFTRTGPVRVRSKSVKGAPSCLCLISIFFTPFFFFFFCFYFFFFFAFFRFSSFFFFLRYFFSLPSDLPTQRNFFFFLFRNAYASSAFFFFLLCLRRLFKELKTAYASVLHSEHHEPKRTYTLVPFFFFFWLF